MERLNRDARRVAQAQGDMYASILAVARAASDDGEIDEFGADEIRVALMWTRRAADAHTELAWQLCERLPMVWEALRAGEIDLPRARVIVDQTHHVEVEAARTVATEILAGAGERTTGQLKAKLRRLVIDLDPTSAAERHWQGVSERRVTVDANDDGTANLHAWNLSADRAQAAMKVVNATARGLASSSDSRTADQRRADVFVDLLTGGSVGAAPRGRVDIHVDLTTLLGLDESPAELPGWGPVIADVARRVVADQRDAAWTFTVDDPDTGLPTWAETTRRRPTAGQTRQVRARNKTCVFPGCRMPATDSDLDHTRDYAKNGPTHEDNLAPLCRHDHRLKHDGGWSVKRIADGIYQWTSRLGQIYITQPRGP